MNKGIIKRTIFLKKIDPLRQIKSEIERNKFRKGKICRSKMLINGTDLSIENQRLEVYSIAINKKIFVIDK